MATHQQGVTSRKRKLVENEFNKAVVWNVPDYICLDPTQSLTIGRAFVADIVMHSPRHPAMLSRKHAMLRFDSSSQQWTIEDLKVSLLYHPSFAPSQCLSFRCRV